MGSISEIFDGDAPMIPRGCFAQAWSVGEVLRVWAKINEPSY
ncbi:Glycogen debranching enzyme [Crocosphaera chwakensis CCY0110]|uniref:Glycogen debranching enzyme n=1 Tax=Crocosphaera chwakensis CCY0110 TaxID=391612 RepID=A3IJB5_9CHRO|nr:Glycogen debranching enzyme [Crocosphaera chwakensis CCY0110]